MDPWLLIVIVGVAVIGYAYMRPSIASQPNTTAVQDMEETLEQFAQELQEDNEQVLQSIVNLKRELEAEINKLSGRVEALEKHPAPVVMSLAPAVTSSSPAPATTPTQLQADQPAAVSDEAADEVHQPVKEPESNIKNRYNAIFELYDKGKSVEFISKKTGMNKGEVQLIIQLAKQEEQFRDEG